MRQGDGRRFREIDVLAAATRLKRHLPLPLFVLISAFVLAYFYPGWVEPQQAGIAGQTPGMLDTSGVPKSGDFAPNFALERADGSVVRLSDFRGRPIVLNFWADWCTGCKQAMEDMQRVADLYGEAIVVIGVNAGDLVEVGEQLANDAGISYERLYDLSLDVSDGYDARAMPTSYFIDAAGRITDVSFSLLDYDSLLGKVASIASPPPAP